MKILNLKEILSRGDIQENIQRDLFETNEELKKAIDITLKSERDNIISAETISRGKIMVFENTLHIDKEKELYLLESRLFDDAGSGQMMGAYLKVFNSNGHIVNECIDDVWVYANWQVA